MPNFSQGITYKTKEELLIMAEAGKKLALVKNSLKNLVKEGANAYQIEELATDMITKLGCKPSFKMVPGYHWSTCVNVNEGLVHGIPKKSLVFKKGDVVSVDVGLFYKGFHSDTSFTSAIDPDKKIQEFLRVGEAALKKAIEKVVLGNRVFDISKVIENTIEGAGYSTIKALVGHGIGKFLHEEPGIPCFVSGEAKDSPEIKNGMTIAIEVMYALGEDQVELSEDGWTISMRDGKISALFEETIAATQKGPQVLTT